MRFRFCGDLDCPDWVLAEIATLSKLTSVRMKVLVGQILAFCIQGSFNYDKVLKLANDNSDGLNDIKGAIAAVHFIISNAGKHDVDDTSLIQEIQQLGLPKENADALGKQYRDYKDMLRETFRQESYRITKLISTDWRVDSVIATSNNDASNDANLMVQLKMEYDIRPQDKVHQAIQENIILSMEMPKAKLDLMVYEMENAVQLLDSLES